MTKHKVAIDCSSLFLIRIVLLKAIHELGTDYLIKYFIQS